MPNRKQFMIARANILIVMVAAFVGCDSAEPQRQVVEAAAKGADPATLKTRRAAAPSPVEPRRVVPADAVPPVEPRRVVPADVVPPVAPDKMPKPAEVADVLPKEDPGRPTTLGSPQPKSKKDTKTPAPHRMPRKDTGGDIPGQPVPKPRPAPPTQRDFENAVDLAFAKDLFSRKCKVCHGLKGDAATSMGKKHKIESWKEPGWRPKWPVAKIVKIVTRGKSETKMKAFKGKLSPKQIEAVSKYARSLGS